ncbi:MAG TPA: hypothetical protein VN844_18575 [Pyrinomonadaceae bacterium]|nr:hypothetical protein [Pyrinomonadaceae bacterium]
MKSKFFFAAVIFFLFTVFVFFFALVSPRFFGAVTKSAGVVVVKHVEQSNVAAVVGRVVDTHVTVSVGKYV